MRFYHPGSPLTFPTWQMLATKFIGVNTEHSFTRWKSSHHGSPPLNDMSFVEIGWWASWRRAWSMSNVLTTFKAELTVLCDDTGGRENLRHYGARSCFNSNYTLNHCLGVPSRWWGPSERTFAYGECTYHFQSFVRRAVWVQLTNYNNCVSTRTSYRYLLEIKTLVSYIH